jgi:phosphoglycolate phosphatase
VAATAAATLHEGARELLDVLRSAGLPVALVTNNTAANTASLLERFALRLDVVLTRDDGVWKPSGAPLVEAARRLSVPVERCAKVGDSRYDLEAGREAGCGCVVLVGPRAGTLRAEADHAFPSLASFVRFLRAVV